MGQHRVAIRVAKGFSPPVCLSTLPATFNPFKRFPWVAHLVCSGIHLRFQGGTSWRLPGGCGPSVTLQLASNLLGTTRLPSTLNGCAQALRQAHISVPFLCSERLRIPLLGLIVAIVHCWVYRYLWAGDKQYIWLLYVLISSPYPILHCQYVQLIVDERYLGSTYLLWFFVCRVWLSSFRSPNWHVALPSDWDIADAALPVRTLDIPAATRSSLPLNSKWCSRRNPEAR